MSAYGGYGHKDYEAVEVFAERLQYAPPHLYAAALADYINALNAITERRTANDGRQISAEKRRRQKVERERQRRLALRTATKMPRVGAARKRKPYKRRAAAKAA